MGLFRKENMEARVTISKETMSKAEKITAKHKGELRLKKLEEIANNGTLQKCKSRYDVAKACGYTDEQRTAGYAWTKNVIKRGKLVEHLAGRNPYTSQAEYEYSLGSEEVKTIELPKEEPVVGIYGVGDTTTLVAIKKGDLSVEITGAPIDYAREIIKTIIK